MLFKKDEKDRGKGKDFVEESHEVALVSSKMDAAYGWPLPEEERPSFHAFQLRRPIVMKQMSTTKDV